MGMIISELRRGDNDLGSTDNRYIVFKIGDLLFEYDESKNKKNLEKHGISFKVAARVFFDYNRIEYFDEENSEFEDRFDTIGDLSAGSVNLNDKYDNLIGNIEKDDILFVVYTERTKINYEGKATDVIRLISARYATSFERGIYYGKY
jgi:hypothetical protein